LERITAAHHVLAQEHLTPTARVVPVLFKAFNALIPSSMQRRLINRQLSKVSVLLSSTDGPTQEVCLAGCPIRSVHVASASIPQHVHTVSLNDLVHTTVTMITAEVPQRVVESDLPLCFLDELVEMAALVGMDRADVMRGVYLPLG
jgi:hypothetical protein